MEKRSPNMVIVSILIFYHNVGGEYHLFFEENIRCLLYFLDGLRYESQISF
jgi:hypothetical protein